MYMEALLMPIALTVNRIHIPTGEICKVNFPLDVYLFKENNE